MRRIAIIGVLAGTSILIMRPRMPKLRERLIAHCEGMFERMPDAFPPRKMMLGIEEIRTTPARIEQSLQCGCEEAAEPTANEAVHHAT